MKKTNRVYPKGYVKANSESLNKSQIGKETIYAYLDDYNDWCGEGHEIPEEYYDQIASETCRLIMESDFEIKNYPEYWYTGEDWKNLQKINKEAYNELMSGEFNPDDFVYKAADSILGRTGWTPDYGEE